MNVSDRLFNAIFSCLAFLITAPYLLAAEPLAYHMTSGQKFSYDLEIQITLPDSIETLKGLIHYQVDAANAEQMQLTYRGGLRESTRSTVAARPGFGGPFGPRGMGFPGMHPFARQTFGGKTQTTNRITLTPQGKILAMQGESQLPYLIGNVSLLPFEVLPKNDQQEWTLDTGVSITEAQEESRRPFGPFGPFGPGSSQPTNNVQAGSEMARYNIQSQNGNLVAIKKSYQLITPETKDNESFDMTGGGVWTFDRQEHVPHAIDYSFKLQVKDKNTSTTIPITMKLKRMTQAEIDAIELEAKRKAEELKLAAEREKAMAESPLTADEKQAVISGLTASSKEDQLLALNAIAKKKPKDPDPQIVQHLDQLRQSPTKEVKELATKVLLNWSPTFKRKHDLNKAYQGPSPVDSTDRIVESTTPLYVGQIVQVQEHGSFWKPAKILELLPDGKVKVGMLVWNEVRQSPTITRRNIQLAPDEVDQPARPKSETLTPTGLRTWADATGRFKIEAEFVSLDAGKVSLKRNDGKIIVVPLEKLSSEDQRVAQDAHANADNPFNQ